MKKQLKQSLFYIDYQNARMIPLYIPSTDG